MYNEFCFALLHGLTFDLSDVLKSNNFHYQNEDTNSFCICISFDRAVHRTSDICTVWTQGYYRCKGIIWWLFSTGWQAVSTFFYQFCCKDPEQSGPSGSINYWPACMFGVFYMWGKTREILSNNSTSAEMPPSKLWWITLHYVSFPWAIHTGPVLTSYSWGGQCAERGSGQWPFQRQ